MTSRTIALAPLLVLAACSTAGEGEFPSLGVRPQENLGFAEPEAPPPIAVLRDSAFDARIVAVTRDRVAAATAFDAAATAAERAAGRGARPGSEAWLEAQGALGELDGARGRTQDALGTLEEMAATRAQALAPAYPPLDAAIIATRAVVAAQTQRADRIAARLRS